MKIKDLLEEIERCKAEYSDFLEWDIYTEQIDECDKDAKWSNKRWKRLKDSEDREYFECVGFWTKFPREKVFTINVNY